MDSNSPQNRQALFYARTDAMTCSTCRQHRDALQQIINDIDAALTAHEWRDTYRHLQRARQLATDAILTPADDEPLGRIEIFSAEGSLLGLGEWRYTNTLHELELLPFPILESGTAHHMMLYAPNGTFMGEASIGDMDSDAKMKINTVHLKQGGTFTIKSIKLSHTSVCPHCGKSLAEAPGEAR